MIGNWPQAPDFIEPIVAYRCWRFRVSERGVGLLPLNLTMDDLLPENEWEGAWRAWVTASCRHPFLESTHGAPDEGCSCGFYAMKSVNDVLFAAVTSHLPGDNPLEGEDGVVLGRVLLAGKVIEHESGYRAERARIAELIPTTTDGGTTRSVASRLGLPLGPMLDTASILRTMEEQPGPSSTVRASRLGPVERWRLKTHRRNFHLIQGAGDD